MDRRSLAALAAAGASPMDTFAQDFQAGMQSGASLAGAVRDSLISERMAKMADAVKDGGDLYDIDESLYADTIGMQALGAFQQHYVSTREGMEKSAKANRELATRTVEEFYGMMGLLDQNKDNPEVAAAIITRISKKLPLPYQVEPGKEPGMLNVYYQDRTGNKPMSQTMSVTDAIGMLKEASRDNKKLMNQVGTYQMMNLIRNMEYKQDTTKYLYTESGQQLVPQKQDHNGYFEAGYLPVGSNEFITQAEAKRRYGNIYTFDQYESVRKMGQGDRQIDISQQNANTSLGSLALSRERFGYETGKDKREAEQKKLDAYEKFVLNHAGYSPDKNGQYFKRSGSNYDGTAAALDYSKPLTPEDYDAILKGKYAASDRDGIADELAAISGGSKNKGGGTPDKTTASIPRFTSMR